MQVLPVERSVEVWKKTFCNITPGFSKYLNCGILRTVNIWGKVLLEKMITVEWSLTVDNDVSCHVTLRDF